MHRGGSSYATSPKDRPKSWLDSTPWWEEGEDDAESKAQRGVRAAGPRAQGGEHGAAASGSAGRAGRGRADELLALRRGVGWGLGLGMPDAVLGCLCVCLISYHYAAGLPVEPAHCPPIISRKNMY